MKPFLLLLFVGSGCAALIYEIVWLQMLQLVIGLTTISVGVLLGAFMGGMCLGSLLFSRLVSARYHPLRVYALLELGIALIGIAVLFGMPHVERLYTSVGATGFAGILLRCFVAGVCLLPPTLLMGATLPAMSRWVEATPRGIAWLGFFYGGNIAGAVFGCLLAGFYLLRIYDMATATYVAAALNVAVAAVSLILAHRMPFKQPNGELLGPVGGPQTFISAVAPPETAVDFWRSESYVSSVATAKNWPVYVAIGLSGMTALGAEVIWTRLLSLLLGGTVYTFSIILAVFLVGLGIGSTLGALASRATARPLVSLGICQISLMGAIAWTAHIIARSLPYWPINPSLSSSPWFIFQLDLVRCLWAVLPAAILWGASFPLALASVASGEQDSARLVGRIYAANTVGAIAGALIFSFLIVPLGGTQSAQRILIGLTVVAALFVFVPVLFSNAKLRFDSQNLGRNGQSWNTVDPNLSGIRSPVIMSKTVVTAVVLLLILIVPLLIWSVSAVPWGAVAYGPYMATFGNRLAPEIIQEQHVESDGTGPDIYCTYVGEGLNGTVAVTQWTSGVRNFHSAGKVQASSDQNDMRLQRMLGHLSALLHKKPESVLVVACGAGVTAGSFVVHPDVKRIVICDIEPLVPQVVAPMFEKENHAVLKDLRTTVVNDDGRHFIHTSKEKFDIITSDPIDPWVKGCAALNTVEYYEMCKAHLNPGGVISLWIPLYQSDSVTVKSIIATFFRVFPNGIMWSNETEEGGYDAVLFGQVSPTQINLGQLQERLDRSDHVRVKQSLRDVGFHSIVSLLSTYAGRAVDLQEWMHGAEINTDRNLRLQYLAGMSFNSYVASEILDEIVAYYRFPDDLFIGPASLKSMLQRNAGRATTSKE